MTAEEFLARYCVRYFYHFTDERNLESIRLERALLPYAELKRRGVAIPAPGGNDWSHEADVRKGLDAFVHLCLHPEHPMEYRAREEGRIENTRFLMVDSQLLTNDGIRFTKDISNKRDIELLTLAEACEQMDFEAIYDHLDWRSAIIRERRQATMKYELLVPGEIPIDLISGF
jgi:hypothetical protein